MSEKKPFPLVPVIIAGVAILLLGGGCLTAVGVYALGQWRKAPIDAQAGEPKPKPGPLDFLSPGKPSEAKPQAKATRKEIEAMASKGLSLKEMKEKFGPPDATYKEIKKLNKFNGVTMSETHFYFVYRGISMDEHSGKIDSETRFYTINGDQEGLWVHRLVEFIP